MYLIDSSLKFILADLDLSEHEAVCGIVQAHRDNNDSKVNESYDQYLKIRRLISIGEEMLIDMKLEHWDWQKAADEGYLCEMDWIWFKDKLEEAKVNKEEYDKKWRIQK